MTVLNERVTTNNNAFIQDELTKSLITRSLKYIKAGYPIHFTGPSGSGKTSIAITLANKLKRPVMLMHGNHELDNKDLIGSFSGYTSSKVVDQYVRSVYKKDETVTESWKDGRLLEAVKNGYTLIYDEFSRSRPATNNIFLSILEEGVLPLYGLKSNRPYVKVHPKFKVIFTSNPNEYAGVYQTQDALLDRLITLYVGFKDKQEEAFILSEKTGLEKDEATIISSLVQNVREEFHERTGAPSLRTSIQIAKIAKNNDIAIEGANQNFQQLCMDLLGHSVVQGLEMAHADANDLICRLCKKTT
ncbi:gas vesicle protein GvpN [Gracilibacillus salitolerans]|uniref:Gas vesicle protein GvpN n=1 Tax=Gracilibacillus salitolerans TaxID=2663022 RepID=A0A5Q2TVC6_9BACI|nr:gas vesicle protein GvpN [Gracilibacillus salitolerans]QGH36778.1 gas vesicle protein GvpN [Gracilibacillus salitolerans]